MMEGEFAREVPLTISRVVIECAVVRTKVRAMPLITKKTARESKSKRKTHESEKTKFRQRLLYDIMYTGTYKM
jgi:hypothetical protein